MQSTISFKAVSKFFLIAAAIIGLVCARVQAQTSNEKPILRERIGVEAADALPLSLNEAIRLALENNNDIRTSRIDEKAEYNLTATRGAYDPKLFAEAYFERTSTPIASFIGGSDSGSLKTKDFTSKIGMSGLAPKFGGAYEFDLSSTRLSSNNFFNALDPAISQRFSFSYTQPLVRGRKTDDTRRQIEIAKKNLTLTDVQFRQRATDVITRVEQAYWELVHSLKSLQVQTEAVKQTRAQVETNKRQVAQGVLAPIDVVEAEAQVKIYEQNVYAAQEEVTRAENALKTLMLADRSAQLWSRALLPVTPVNLEAPRMHLSDAVNTALQNRFELAELRTNKDINEINKRFYRDQTKPQVDLQVKYSSNGYAGTLTDNENPIMTGFTSLEKRVSELSTLAGLPVLEKEVGTVEQLLMTPAGSAEIILAKMAPIFLLLSFDIGLSAAVGNFVFGVPLRGSLVLLYGSGMLCVLSGIGIGTIIATFTRSQQQAQLMSFFVNPPLSMLSGATTPIEAMPQWLQPFTNLNPVKHFAVLARGVMLKGVGLEVLYPNFLALVAFTIILVGVSAWRFRKQLN